MTPSTDTTPRRRTATRPASTGQVRVVLPLAVADEAAVARLWLLGASGVWETADEVVATFDSVDALPIDLPAAAVVEAEPDVDWQTRFEEGLAPVRAGRFRVVPSRMAGAIAPSTMRDAFRDVVLDPGEAFGSGHHATTTMCLRMLDALARDGRVAGRRVADLGSGTGVLAIAAAFAGADPVVACDVDEAAVRVTRRHAEANGVLVDAFVGSADQLAERGPFDLVLANLLTDTLVDLAPQLRALLSPGGCVVVSGMSSERAAEPLAALAEQRLTLRRQTSRDGWVAACLER